MSLSAEQILAADDLPRVRVDVPEWAPAGTDPAEAFVFVRRMTGEELDEYEEALRKRANGDDTLKEYRGLRATVVVLATCDEFGKRLFTIDQLAALSGKSADPIKRIFSAASDHNGLGKAAAEKLEKN